MNPRRFLTAFCSGLLLATAAPAATFTVINTADSGAGSLRQAISDASATAGHDTIEFNIPGAAQPVINLATTLPALNGDTLDGLTQPGGNKVKVSYQTTGPSSTGTVLAVVGEGAVIQGLQFHSEAADGAPPPVGSRCAIRLAGTGSHVVRASLFTGRQAGVNIGSSNNTVGGGTGMRNRFEVYIAVFIRGSAATPASENKIQGNEFLPPVDTLWLSTSFAATIYAPAFSEKITIESDSSTGAVNTFDGVLSFVNASNSPNLVFRGNRAGDNAPNATNLAGFNNGLIILTDCSGAVVENNSLLQSGNKVISLSGTDVRVLGNTIRNTGAVATTNTNTGITLLSPSSNARISGNVIGGLQEGIRVVSGDFAGLSGLLMDGNFVGLKEAYTPASESPVAVPDSSLFLPCDAGIIVEGYAGPFEIGGVANTGTGHLGPNTVICTYAGISLMPSPTGSPPNPQLIRMDRNRIALMSSTAPGMGGPGSVAGQWIMLTNTYRGGHVFYTGYSIPANDVNDSDVGSNDLLNYPTIAMSPTQVTGTLDTKPNITCTIQVNACATDGAVLTGIPVFIGSTSVITDGSGHASYAIPLASPPPSGSIFYAMATDNAGNTSHIGSKALGGLPTVNLTLPAPEARAVEGTPFPVTVTRTGTDLSIASTVKIVVTPGDAAAPAINGTAADVGTPAPVTFLPGESSKDVLIPIIDDDLTEPAEKLRITLQTAGGADLGTVTTGFITINYSDLPRVSIGNATVTEGNAGAKVVTLPVSLDRPMMTGFPPSNPFLRFRFVGGTATRVVDYNRADAGGEDFLSVQFFPGAIEGGEVHIVIFGDTVYEPNETVIVEYDHTSQTYADGSPLVDDTHHPQGTLTIQNDDQAVVRIVPLDVTVTEGDSGTTPANLSIQLVDGPIDVEVRVPWQTVNGTATAGSDFTAASGEVVLAPGTSSQTISVQVTGDTLVDNWPAVNESFTVQLGTPVNAIIAPGQGSATIAIQDDDARNITLSDASLTEGNSGTSVMTFTATIPSPTGSPVSFDWSTAADTANASDYTDSSGTLTIPAGETNATFNIQIKGDTLYENNETFTVASSASINGNLTRESATGTILNDDTPPTMAIQNTVVTEGTDDVDFYAWFLVRLSAASGAPVTFQWSTVAGTATPGLDYTESSNTAVIPAGARDYWIAVPVLGDNISDGDETFQVRIPGASGATVPQDGLTGTCTLKETAITKFAVFSGVPGLYALSFWTGRGQSYVIERSFSLGDELGWDAVTGIIAGSGAEISQPLFFPNDPHAYFRVRVTATPPNQ